ncbi:MAG: phosphatase PAP2 family protein [Clostridia bacterium]|nr:phosphatase PAP2 family protein [Clostridia bacterium]
MEFLYFLEGIRNPVFDFFFETITHLGEETFFLLIAIFFFWCVDKREGYYILLIGLYGTVINQIAKITFRIERPWVKDPNFTVVGDAKIEATGYSFPSGHTQNMAGTLGAIAAYNKKRLASIISVTVIALVAFSRMYLGVHTPLDVGVSLLLAAVLVIFLRPLFASEEKFVKSFPWLVISAVVLSLGFIIYVLLLSGDTSIDAENYASALKNSCTLMGCLPGLLLVYFVDTKWLKFDTGARWYAQIIKLLVGLAGVLAIKSGLSTPLALLFGNELVARIVRYFLMVSFAGAIWPMTFSRFARLRIGALEKFSEKVVRVFKKSGNVEK